MTGPLTTYGLSDGIATITMDDGKVNALSAAMLASVSARLDEALAEPESAAGVVILTGRERTFSAGFDLRTPAEGWREMLIAGARLARQLMVFPRPTVIACNGNAIAMGGFLLLSADHRIGTAGEFRIGLNEVAIGLTMPRFGVAIARHRLARPYFDRCTVTGVTLAPEEAVSAGFLDQIVPAETLVATARAVAMQLSGVDLVAHAATKVRVRADAIAGIQDGIDVIANEDGGW